MKPLQWKVATLLAPLVLSSGGAAHAILFTSSADPTYHADAPQEIYESSGWQHQGTFGLVAGTIISSSHFITAAHADNPTSVFVHNGNSYPILSKSQVPGTDLLVAEVAATFSDWAQLYTGTAPIGREVVMMGMGGPRSSAITTPTGELQGWLPGSPDAVLRWGTNVIDGVQESAAFGELLFATFDDGPDEAGLSLFDSGGGVFVLDDDGTWKLAGINYGADTFASNSDGTGRFVGALFDPSGFYRLEDGSWEQQTKDDPGTRYYFSSISAASSAISDITATVPEPSASLYVVALLYFCGRRRRSANRL